MVFILQHLPGITSKELADRYKVSVRTVYRDLATLQDAGVPIYNDTDGFRVEKEWKHIFSLGKG